MRVSDLIARLGECDDEATVYVVESPRRVAKLLGVIGYGDRIYLDPSADVADSVDVDLFIKQGRSQVLE